MEAAKRCIKGDSQRKGSIMNQDITSNETPKKRGSKSASVTANNTAKKEEISQIIHESFQFFNNSKVKTDDECAERLNEYFKLCSDTGQIPTVEDMCLCLGSYRREVWDWEARESQGAVRANMIKKAKEILAGIDAKLVSQGKIPQITYIFRAKNFFGMVDKQEHILTPNNLLEPTTTPEDMARLIDSSIPDDE